MPTTFARRAMQWTWRKKSRVSTNLPETAASLTKQ
jgi:hypothetical protein